LNQACEILKRDRKNCDPYKDAIGEATKDILERKKEPGNHRVLPREYFSEISSDDKTIIKDYLGKELAAVRNA